MKFKDAWRRRSGQLTTAAILFIVFAAGFALGNQYSIGAAQSELSAPPDSDELFAPFWQVYNLIQNEYVDPEGEPIDEQALIDGAINGMVEALGDQFSGYMDAETFPVVNQELEGEFTGIGVVIRTVEETGEITVVSLLEGAPAQAAGILPGDVFVRVNGEEVVTMSQVEFASKVRGPEGTEVLLTVRRDEELLDFTIVRAVITVPNIEFEVVGDNIAYVRLNQFSPQAREEIDNALAELDVNERNGLIFDLRSNPGGLLSTAIDVGSAFIPEGTLLIEDFGMGREKILSANGDFANITVPVVVLVDEGSASASELVAGALQDNDRATIIGEVTFGKGTVQTWQQLVNGGGIRLTIARWLTPNRNWIHSLGITPDIVVEWDPEVIDEDTEDPQLQAAIDFLQAEAVTAESP